MKQIRILMYIGSLNLGGSQTMIMELYRNINHKEIQFDFVVDKKNEVYFQKEIESLGGKVFFLPPYKGNNHLAFKKAWNDFFRSHPEYKIIHSHVRSTASIVLNIAKKNGLITISHSHNTSNGKDFSSIIKRIYQLRIRYVADYFIGCSRESALWLFGKKIANSNRCFVLNNSINTDKFLYNVDVRSKIRKGLNIEDRFVIGHVGRFSVPKNHSFLIEIFNEYLKNNKSAYLILVGDDGVLKKDIESKINDLKIADNVLILTNRNDVNELLQAMDVFVMPSLYEGLPVTLIEAQASGIPIVMSNIITDEAIVTNLVKKVDLNESIEKWCEVIKNYETNKRINTKKDIIKSGYDIKENVRFITSFYKRIYKESR